MKIHFSPFSGKYFFSNHLSGVTAFGGLSLFRNLLRELRLTHEAAWFGLKRSGYSDETLVEAIILMLAAGGTCLSDWEWLKSDPGFCRLFPAGMSVDSIERYLDRLFVADLEGVSTGQGRVGFSELVERLHVRLIKQAWEKAGKPGHLTIDLDATLIETSKDSALYCYDKFKAYHPLIAYCPELNLVVAHEFRDGNISPALGLKRIVKRVQKMFPNVKFTVRSDSAGYIHDFMDWMAGENMLFYITADQRSELLERIALIKETEYKPIITDDGITTDQEYAFVHHGPSFQRQAQLELRVRKRDYILTRKKIKEATLIDKPDYSYSVVCTNDQTNDPLTIINTHRKRCGSVEFAHNQIKSQCGQNKMPSNKFNVNAAYFSLGVLAHNLFRYLQNFILPEQYKRSEIQTIRFRFICVVAKIIHKARSIVIKFTQNHPLKNILPNIPLTHLVYSP